MDDGNYSQFRRVVEEYMVAIELGQHDKVPNLSSKICSYLVELYDDELQQRDEFSKPSNDANSEQRSSSLSRSIETICHKLRRQSKLASAYDEVIEFVRLQDLHCLAKLVGANPPKKHQYGGHKTGALDFNSLLRVLRNAIYSLKSMNTKESSAHPDSGIMVKKEYIVRIPSSGFPIYRINIDAAFVEVDQRPVSTNSDGFLPRDRNNQSTVGSALLDNLQSKWFQEFVDRTLEKSYPVDRFTILVAFLVIAVECRHRELEQLVSELLDQIFHEESNSCNEEDLMQLTQVGAFWLSYHRRYLATMNQTDLQEADEDDIVSESQSELSSDGELSSSSTISKTDSKLRQEEFDHGYVHNASSELVRREMDPRLRLKRAIDDEILRGAPCLVCGHQSSQPLEPLNSETCSQCSSGPSEYCSISYQPFKLLDLKTLRRLCPSLTQLVVVSPNEWARQMIRCSSSRRNHLMEPIHTMKTIGERVDISERFERLTVIRGPKRGEDTFDGDDRRMSIRKPSHSSSDDDDADDDADDELDNEVSSGKDKQTVPESSYIQTLESFMIWRCKPQQKSQLSESMSMLKFLGKEACIELPLFMADLLLTDSVDDSVEFRLVTSRSVPDELWSCSSRSHVSNLMFGCGRFFRPLDLIDRKFVKAGDFMCPYCECRLSKVSNLTSGLEIN